MNVFDFLAHLRSLDIQVTANQGRLQINAPQGAVTLELKDELNARKGELLSVLSLAEPALFQPQDGPLSLSAAQEHLWQLHRLTPDTAAYNMYAVFRLHGELNLLALETAIRSVVQRHTILRTSFPKSVDGGPEVRILPSSYIHLRQITSLSAITGNELQSVIHAELSLPFDLSAGPLLRPTLVHIEPGEYMLILVVHHIAFDGHSFNLLYQDLERAYRAACEGVVLDWPPLLLQYTDYAAWQRSWLESEADASDRKYWQLLLEGDVMAPELPIDHPYPMQTSPDGGFVELPLQPQLCSALYELCRREGVTLFTAVLVAFDLLLHRHSGQRDLLVCTPVAARDRLEFSRLIGYFNNTLLLRNDLTRVNTIHELLQQTQALVMNALAHQMFPFREVASFLNLARTPLSRAMVVVLDSTERSFQLTGLEIEEIPAFSGAVQYDLSVEMLVSPNRLEGRMMYRTVLFEHDNVERLATELVEILEEMCADVGSAISQSIPSQMAARSHREPVKRHHTAPRTDLEQRLAQIWQEVLNVESIGIHDEFFELGGHSLLALRLFTRIERETGTGLPLSTLVERTTIARLAQLIEGGPADLSWDVLVPIQPQGSKPPFFAIQGVEGGVLGYRDLANALGDDQPFLGLQAFGQDGRQPYDSSIDDMASRYIQVMRAYQPVGPYRIGGYCFGGVVAYEMARQLEQLGEQVSLLAVFEGAMPDEPDSRVPLVRRLGVIWKSLPTWIKDYSSMSPHQLLNRLRSTYKKIWSKLQRDPELERRVRVEETLDIDVNNLPGRHIEMTDANLKAALQYDPGEYQGTVTLFRARNRSFNEIVFGSLDPKMGWGRLAKGGVDVRLVDGFHRNMHLEPYVQSLAAELKKCLERNMGE